MKGLIIIICCISWLYVSNLTAQVNDEGFRINGSAIQLDQQCYQLTPAEFDQAGSMWNVNQINLQQSFQVLVHVVLGCLDEDGADGITFALQPVSTTLGEVGEGIGLQDIRPSLGIEFDTWQNFNLDDPEFDHIAIIRDGNLNHAEPNTLSGPVMAIPNEPNVEDCDTHSIKISWDAEIQMLQVYFDCEPRLSYQGDMVQEIFGGDPHVFWGFTSATGGSVNIHTVCFIYSTILDQLGTTGLCIGDSLQINLPDNGLLYSWSPSTFISDPTIPNPIIYPPIDMDYIVAITDECGDAILDTLAILVRDVQFDSVQIFDYNCDENYAQLNLNVSNGFPSYDFSLDGQPFQGESFYDSVSFGNHLILVRDSLFCLDSLLLGIENVVGPRIDSLVLSRPSCMDDGEASIFTSGGTGEILYALQNNDFVSQSIFTGLGPGNYQVRIRDSLGCEFVSDSFELLRDTLRIINVAKQNASCNQSNGTIQANVTGGNGSISYSVDEINYQSALVFNLPKGQYHISAMDESGCMIQSEEIILLSDCSIYIPNAFSPNDDGLNDVWLIYADESLIPRISRALIFDRFGNLVWEEQNFSPNNVNHGWNGKTLEYYYSPQVFTYFLEYELSNGEVFRLSGDITLIR